MKVLIIATGEVLDLDAPYAVRLIEQRRAVLAGDVPASDTPAPVDYTQLGSDAAAMKAILKAIVKTPDLISVVAASGQAGTIYQPGDEIIIPWTDNSGADPVTHQYPFVVVDIADCYDENNVLHKNAIWLMAKNCTPTSMRMQYDAPETNNAKGCLIWSQSSVRQWLNSDAAKNTGWWTSQHEGDTAPDSAYTNLPGWMNGFTAEWKAIFKPVKVTTATGEETGSPEETSFDTFFLPSISQLYGDPGTVEGLRTPPLFTESDTAWKYIKENSTSDVPTNNGNYLPLDIFSEFNKVIGATGLTYGSVLLRGCCYIDSSSKHYFNMNYTSFMVEGDDFANRIPWPFSFEMTTVNKSFNMNPCCVLY